MRHRLRRWGRWPKDESARGMARAVTAEMHSSFRALRSECPMNVRARIEGHRISEECKQDIVRVLQIWAEARARHGQRRTLCPVGQHQSPREMQVKPITMLRKPVLHADSFPLRP